MTSNLSKSVLSVTKGGVISVDEDVRLVVKVGQYELTLPCVLFNINDLKSVVMKLGLEGEVELTSDSYRNTFIKSLDGRHRNATFYTINAIFYIQTKRHILSKLHECKAEQLTNKMSNKSKVNAKADQKIRLSYVDNYETFDFLLVTMDGMMKNYPVSCCSTYNYLMNVCWL
jgi:hypothetical protein